MTEDTGRTAIDFDAILGGRPITEKFNASGASPLVGAYLATLTHDEEAPSRAGAADALSSPRSTPSAHRVRPDTRASTRPTTSMSSTPSSSRPHTSEQLSSSKRRAVVLRRTLPRPEDQRRPATSLGLSSSAHPPELRESLSEHRPMYGEVESLDQSLRASTGKLSDLMVRAQPDVLKDLPRPRLPCIALPLMCCDCCHTIAFALVYCSRLPDRISRTAMTMRLQ